MIVLDVNVLVAAFIVSHSHHDSARRFVQTALQGVGGVGVPDVVWSGLVRTVTNPRVVDPPATWAEVRAFVDAIQRNGGYRPQVRAITSPLSTFLVAGQAAKGLRMINVGVSWACRGQAGWMV